MGSRVQDWPLILAATVEEWRARAFNWEDAKCSDFAAAVSTALTGVDQRAKFPPHASQEAAAALLLEHGGMEPLVSFAFGEPKPVAKAMRGDLIVADFGHGPAVGVCVGVNICTPGARGLVFLPTSRATAAWTV